MMSSKRRKTIIIFLIILLSIPVLYLSGLISGFISEYNVWMKSDGLISDSTPPMPDFDFFYCLKNAFSVNGVIVLISLLLIAVCIIAYYRISNRMGGKDYDPRGFRISKDGTYGTAERMTEKEIREDLELSTPVGAKGTILGEYRNKVVCMPVDTKLNRHIAIFGASGTMKSRAIIRNALFQCIRNSESAVITDPKGELYRDTAELFRKNGYEVKVFNLVNPSHSDSWNCMSDLNGDTLLAQVLTDVIIGNTASGKSDGFWEDGAGDLLKALILYVDTSGTVSEENKNLAEVYRTLCKKNERELAELFGALEADNPAKVPFSFFAQSSEKVKSGIIMGLGTRLQVLQNEAVQRITSRSDIDLTAPGRHKCAYYIILSDRDSTMAFMSSLFFSSLFIKLISYADAQSDGKCKVPVNLILDEFNNIGRLGGAADGSDFARTLSVIRSRDIKVMIAVQSLGQLQNRYPNNLWAEIIGNCDIQLMLGCTDDVTAEYFSARSGEMSIIVDSTRVSKRSIALAQFIPLYQETNGQGKRRLLTPDEVLRLPKNELLAIIRGHNILWLNKFDFTGHPMSKEIIKTNISEYHPEDKNRNSIKASQEIKNYKKDKKDLWTDPESEDFSEIQPNKF